jgi:hypothetical protein
VKRNVAAPMLALFLLLPTVARVGAQAGGAAAPARFGDSVSWVPAGSLVRVTQNVRHPARETGWLVQADSVIARQRWGRGMWTVPAAAVQRFEVGHEEIDPQRHKHRGALIGFLIGAVPTAVAVAAAAGQHDPACDVSICFPPAAIALTLGVPFTLLTTGVGAIVDHHRGRGAGESVSWSPVPLPVRIASRDSTAAAAP